MAAKYSIEIVPADRGWILEQIANQILEQSLLHPETYDVRIVDTPSDSVDLTFFLPESAFVQLQHSTTVTYFAHKEEDRGAAALFEKVADQTDYCITSSSKYKKVLEQSEGRKVFKLHLGVDTELFSPQLKIGVVGRTYHTNRKGEGLLAEINNMPMVDLKFTGEGWPSPARYYSNQDLAQFYRDIDYLLIPSLIEGGPVPMLEALSSGCPVIAPTDIGLVEDFPHIPFKLGDANDLRRVIETLLVEKQNLRSSVLDCDWKLHAKRTLDIFAEIISSTRTDKNNEALSTSSAPPSPRTLLITHGAEQKAKGGPSTRIEFIQKHLAAQGFDIDRLHGIANVNELRNVDIVHIFNSWNPQSALETFAIAKLAGKKIVFSPIALDLQNYPVFQHFLEHIISNHSLNTLEQVLEALPSLIADQASLPLPIDSPVEGVEGHFESLRRCCALADHLIFLSQHEKQFLSEIGVDISKGTTIRNGTDPDFGKKGNIDRFRDKFKLKKYILCVGRIEYRKNQAVLAHALKDAEVSLVLLGGVGDANYLDTVKALGGSNVVHIPRIDDRDLLASAYLGASAFVLPSWCEGAPMSALEAAACGTPLILSSMSGEAEYFGELAQYVSPADAEEIASAVLKTLASPESIEKRQARIDLIKQNFTHSSHSDESAKVYQLVHAEASAQTYQDIYLDVSAMLHYYRVDHHLTGIPLAERNIVAEIMVSKPQAKCIVYNDSLKRFIEIPYSVFNKFDSDEFNQQFWYTNQNSEETPDYRYVCKLVVPPPSTVSVENDTAQQQDEGIKKFAKRIYHGFYRIEVLRPSLTRLKNSAYFSVHHLRLIKQRLKSRRNNVVLGPTFNTLNLSEYFDVVEVSTKNLNIRPGSRIITLGQGWISNEPLLDELRSISAGNLLEAYVYDISYISGSHYSGWEDNADRQRRVDKLLELCSTVYTESKLTASELVKYGRSRSWNYQVVRTKLRGKEPSPKTGKRRVMRKHQFVLFVASFNKRKNHDFIVNVWKDLQKSENYISRNAVKLYLVGEIQGEVKYGDPSLISELRRHNIEVLGGIPEEQLDKVYNDCLFTVFPSLQEGWGIPIEESLLYGKVCLTSDSVPAAQEINNPALIKINPHDFFGWREAINSWAANGEMRDRFSDKAREYKPVAWSEIAQCILERRNFD